MRSDDLVAKVRAICLALPGAEERVSHGAPAFYAPKQFVQLWPTGHHDHDFPHLWCAAPPGAQEAMIAAAPERFFRPPYVGGRGWLGLRLDGRVDWVEVDTHCEAAYRTVAPRRLLSELESRAPAPAPAPGPGGLLAAYDAQLRGVAEMRGTASWDRDGPLYRGQFEHTGFVSYDSLADVDDIDALIERTVAYYEGLAHIEELEWKTRGHDAPADLGARLQRAGFVPEEVETVMVGEAARLAVEVPLPDGVVIRRVDHLPERAEVIAAATHMQLAAFGGGPSTEEVISRLDRMGGHEQFWVAEASGRVVCAGRLSRVAGTEFAGLWGGVTDPEWRHKGIYRALTAARARAAIDAGVRYLHSDCTAMSRPILERSGLVAVTTTTPYVWRR